MRDIVGFVVLLMLYIAWGALNRWTIHREAFKPEPARDVTEWLGRVRENPYSVVEIDSLSLWKLTETGEWVTVDLTVDESRLKEWEQLND